MRVERKISTYEKDISIECFSKPNFFWLVRISTFVHRWAKCIINKKGSGLRDHRILGLLPALGLTQTYPKK